MFIEEEKDYQLKSPSNQKLRDRSPMQQSLSMRKLSHEKNSDKLLVVPSTPVSQKSWRNDDDLGRDLNKQFELLQLYYRQLDTISSIRETERSEIDLPLVNQCVGYKSQNCEVTHEKVYASA